jgi:hypothetical protein
LKELRAKLKETNPAILVPVLVSLNDGHAVRTSAEVTSSVGYGITHGTRDGVLVCVEVELVNPTVDVQVVTSLFDHVAIRALRSSNSESHGARVGLVESVEVVKVGPARMVVAIIALSNNGPVSVVSVGFSNSVAVCHLEWLKNFQIEERFKGCTISSRE